MDEQNQDIDSKLHINLIPSSLINQPTDVILIDDD
jgi:hypothetical protein